MIRGRGVSSLLSPMIETLRLLLTQLSVFTEVFRWRGREKEGIKEGWRERRKDRKTGRKRQKDVKMGRKEGERSKQGKTTKAGTSGRATYWFKSQHRPNIYILKEGKG